MIKKEYIFLALIAIAFFSGGFFTKQYVQPSKDWKSELDSINKKYNNINTNLSLILEAQNVKQKKSKQNLKKNAAHLDKNYNRTFSDTQLDSLNSARQRAKEAADARADSLGL